jgi:hypothetical protein
MNVTKWIYYFFTVCATQQKKSCQPALTEQVPAEIIVILYIQIYGIGSGHAYFCKTLFG